MKITVYIYKDLVRDVRDVLYTITLIIIMSQLQFFLNTNLDRKQEK